MSRSDGSEVTDWCGEAFRLAGELDAARADLRQARALLWLFVNTLQDDPAPEASVRRETTRNAIEFLKRFDTEAT